MPGRKKNLHKIQGEEKILGEYILRIFRQFPDKTFNYKQLGKLLEAETGLEKSELRLKTSEHLILLKRQELLIEISQGKFKLNRIHSTISGCIQINPRGIAYVISDESKEDIFIAPGNIRNALDGDTVTVSVFAKRPNKKPEGEIVEILKRARTEFVGVVQLSKRFAFLIPDNAHMQVDIFIPLEHLNHAKDGDKAIASITNWEKGMKNPTGKITSVLGKPGENNTEINSIIAEYGFSPEFPRIVLKETEEYTGIISAHERKQRRDFRPVTTFTIDPADARDFDDALSIKKTPGGHWEIGVHIADVSHYVRPGTLLEEEAAKRATSVYLVDRVIPMLPEKLSNNVCSLVPGEERLCFSIVFEITEEGNIVKQWIGKTVILSDKRFTYEEAQDIIKTSAGQLSEEILVLHKIAEKLRLKRIANGAILFERGELKFRLDENGFPIETYLKESKDSHKLIEEFMLLANKRVAEFVHEEAVFKNAFVYRVHAAPPPDKLNTFSRFAGKFGYKINIHSGKTIASSINHMVKNIAGKPEQNLLEQVALRAMAKASYTTQNIGHYGLAFDFYTHFTSPIRRYPDLMVHRLVAHYLEKKNISINVAELEQKCRHSTEMEIQASSAERSSVKYKQAQYIGNRIGEEFEGVISGITEWGIYVELSENKCEGMIRLKEIDDDFYELDENNYCIRGRRNKRKFTLGDPLKIRVKKTDLLRRTIDFTLVE